MGSQNIISKFSQRICAKTIFYKILILGTEGSGKTTLFDRIKSNEVLIRNPTIGFNVERIKIDKFNISFWDFGGHDKIINLYDKYLTNTDIIILVIDSTDDSEDNVLQNKRILKMIQENAPDCYVIIVINKIDLNKESIKTEEIVKSLDLFSYKLKIANILRMSCTHNCNVKEIKNLIKSTLRSIENKLDF